MKKAYSEPRQASKMDIFVKIIRAESRQLFWQKAPT